MRYLLGNWKMNMSLTKISEYTANIKKINPDVFVGVAVPSVYYGYCYKLKTKMAVGLQNVSEYTAGAYTGEISAQMLADTQADFCLVGHSERRQYFGETDEIVNLKLKQLATQSILAVLCVGETLQEYESDKTKEVLERQIKIALQGITPQTDLVIAYEPVWAIGTGKTAKPEEISEICGFIKNITKEILGREVSVLYGGSVKSTNSQSIINQPNVDGALVGGASQDAQSFIQILKSFL